MALNVSNKTSKFYIVTMSALTELLILFHAVCGHNVTTIFFRFIAEKKFFRYHLKTKTEICISRELYFFHIIQKHMLKKFSHFKGHISLHNSKNRY
jgi:hypothetical protein